jgi:hypothetical protein
MSPTLSRRRRIAARAFRRVHGCPHIAAPAHPHYDARKMSPEPMDIAMKRAASWSASLARPAIRPCCAAAIAVLGALTSAGAQTPQEAIAVLPVR